MLTKDDLPERSHKSRPAEQRRTAANPRAAAAEGNDGIGRGRFGIFINPPG
jgi:hypothetical protein